MTEIQTGEPLRSDVNSLWDSSMRDRLVHYLNLVLKATNLQDEMGWDRQARVLRSKPSSLFTEKELRDLVRLISILGLGNLGGRVIFLRSSLPNETRGVMLVPLRRVHELVHGAKDWLQNRIFFHHKNVLIRYILICTPAWYESHYARPLAGMEPIIRELLDDKKLVAAPEKGPFEHPLMPWRQLMSEGCRKTLYTLLLAIIVSRALKFLVTWFFGNETINL